MSFPGLPINLINVHKITLAIIAENLNKIILYSELALNLEKNINNRRKSYREILFYFDKSLINIVSSKNNIQDYIDLIGDNLKFYIKTLKKEDKKEFINGLYNIINSYGDNILGVEDLIKYLETEKKSLDQPRLRKMLMSGIIIGLTGAISAYILSTKLILYGGQALGLIISLLVLIVLTIIGYNLANICGSRITTGFGVGIISAISAGILISLKAGITAGLLASLLSLLGFGITAGIMLEAFVLQEKKAMLSLVALSALISNFLFLCTILYIFNGVFISYMNKNSEVNIEYSLLLEQYKSKHNSEFELNYKNLEEEKKLLLDELKSRRGEIDILLQFLENFKGGIESDETTEVADATDSSDAETSAEKTDIGYDVPIINDKVELSDLTRILNDVTIRKSLKPELFLNNTKTAFNNLKAFQARYENFIGLYNLCKSRNNNTEYFFYITKQIQREIPFLLGIVISNLCGLFVSVYDKISDPIIKKDQNFLHYHLTIFCQGIAGLIFGIFIVYMVKSNLLGIFDTNSDFYNKEWTYYAIALVCGWLARSILDNMEQRVINKYLTNSSDNNNLNSNINNPTTAGSGVLGNGSSNV